MPLPRRVLRLAAPLVSLMLLPGCMGLLGDEPVAEPAPVEDELVASADAPADEAPREEEPAPAPTPTSTSSSAGTANASASASEPAPPAPPRIEVFAWEGSITSASPGTGGAALVCCPDVVVEEENADGTFELPAGARGVVVELVWSDPQFDLDLVVEGPDVEEVLPPEPDGTTVKTRKGHIYRDTDGSAGAPDGRAVIVLTEEEALALSGTWVWRVHTKTANAVAFTLAVSLFHDSVPAEGYTALAG